MNPKTIKSPALRKPEARDQKTDFPADVMLSKKELAPKLGVSVRTIENWQHKRYLPFLKIDNVVIFHWPTVLAHLLTHFSVAPCGGPPVRAARALKTEI